MSKALPGMLWGWNRPARVVLGLLAILGTIALWGVEPSQDGATQSLPTLVLDPNTAPPGALAALPKLGPALVGRIVAARDERPFDSVEDLDARVRGIGPATIAGLRPHLRIVGTVEDSETAPEPSEITSKDELDR